MQQLTLLLSDSPLPFILIILVIIIIGLIAQHFNRKNIIIRKFSKISLKPQSSIKTNELAKFHGKSLHVKEPLIAPFSKRKCVFYYMKIMQRKSSGKSSYWKTLVHKEEIQDFFVEHNGDFVIIKPTNNPKNYESYLVVDKETSSGTFSDASPEFEKLLKQYNIESTGMLGFNKQLKYEEGIIEIGEKITVAGIAVWKSLSEPISEYPYSKIVAFESGIKQKILISDLPEVLNYKRR